MVSSSLDTNVLLRLLLNDIPAQHEAVKELLTHTDSSFSVADIAIVELAFALQKHYGFNREQVAEAVAGLIRLGSVKCNRNLFESALPVFIECPALSFEDCCLAAYAKLNDAEPLWTFDKKLASQSPSAKLLS